ncbi:hypothetical protein D3C73_1626950 [compost metagenome]
MSSDNPSVGGSVGKVQIFIGEILPFAKRNCFIIASGISCRVARDLIVVSFSFKTGEDIALPIQTIK